MAEQIKALLSSNQNPEMLNFLLDNEVIPEELEIGLAHARRARAIDKYNTMLESNCVEADWQKWFEENSWVLLDVPVFLTD